jgi:hypothetical protein
MNLPWLTIAFVALLAALLGLFGGAFWVVFWFSVVAAWITYRREMNARGMKARKR